MLFWGPILLPTLQAGARGLSDRLERKVRKVEKKFCGFCELIEGILRRLNRIVRRLRKNRALKPFEVEFKKALCANFYWGPALKKSPIHKSAAYQD